MSPAEQVPFSKNRETRTMTVCALLPLGAHSFHVEPPRTPDKLSVFTPASGWTAIAVLLPPPAFRRCSLLFTNVHTRTITSANTLPLVDPWVATPISLGWPRHLIQARLARLCATTRRKPCCASSPRGIAERWWARTRNSSHHALLAIALSTTCVPSTRNACATAPGTICGGHSPPGLSTF